MTAEREVLNRQLLAAHTQGDGLRLADLYHAAAQALEKGGDTNAAAFFMTHAYVFALETAAPSADMIAQWLRERGRL